MAEQTAVADLTGDYYTVAEVAAHLKVSRQAVYDLVRRGEMVGVPLPGFKRPPLRIPATSYRAYTERALPARPTLLPVSMIG
jgi:excisionase family DNA binding protein